MSENNIREESRFVGSAWSIIGYAMLFVLCFAGAIFTFGFSLAWWYKSKTGWKISNTIIEGKKLAFSGTSAQIWGTIVSSAIFIVLTLGIYSCYAEKRLSIWEAKHTSFSTDAKHEKTGRTYDPGIVALFLKFTVFLGVIAMLGYLAMAIITFGGYFSLGFLVEAMNYIPRISLWVLIASLVFAILSFLAIGVYKTKFYKLQSGEKNAIIFGFVAVLVTVILIVFASPAVYSNFPLPNPDIYTSSVFIATVVLVVVFVFALISILKKNKSLEDEWRAKLEANEYGSEFTGSAWSILKYRILFILAALVSVVTLGFSLAAYNKAVMSWKVRHTIIEKHKIEFDGTSGQMWGTVALNLLLTIVTLGIFGPYAEKRIEMYRAKHTYFI